MPRETRCGNIHGIPYIDEDQREKKKQGDLQGEERSSERQLPGREALDG